MKHRTKEEQVERKAKRLAKRKALGLGSRVKRKKLPSHSICERRYWDAFAAYIRYRDKDKGCFSCRGPVQAAGHVISRRKRATRYDEENVLGQCHRCNWKDKYEAGYHDVCVSAFIAIYGVQKFHSLVELSKTFCERPSRVECLMGEARYKNKLDALKNNTLQPDKDLVL